MCSVTFENIINPSPQNLSPVLIDTFETALCMLGVLCAFLLPAYVDIRGNGLSDYPVR